MWGEGMPVSNHSPLALFDGEGGGADHHDNSFDSWKKKKAPKVKDQGAPYREWLVGVCLER